MKETPAILCNAPASIFTTIIINTACECYYTFITLISIADGKGKVVVIYSKNNQQNEGNKQLMKHGK
jgi:hypothetical protein